MLLCQFKMGSAYIWFFSILIHQQRIVLDFKYSDKGKSPPPYQLLWRHSQAEAAVFYDLFYKQL